MRKYPYGLLIITETDNQAEDINANHGDDVLAVEFGTQLSGVRTKSALAIIDGELSTSLRKLDELSDIQYGWYVASKITMPRGSGKSPHFSVT